VPRGANIEDGIVLSGLLEQCDDVDLGRNKVGLYGVIKPLSEILTEGDRIEIYRPVTAKE
jgi:putative ubiquitin-RnfH superfamily antitoxin RatB of RatAB toxin-antitoxin module